MSCFRESLMQVGTEETGGVPRLRRDRVHHTQVVLVGTCISPTLLRNGDPFPAPHLEEIRFWVDYKRGSF